MRLTTEQLADLPVIAAAAIMLATSTAHAFNPNYAPCITSGAVVFTDANGTGSWGGDITQSDPYTFNVHTCAIGDVIYTDSLETAQAGPWWVYDQWWDGWGAADFGTCLMRPTRLAVVFDCRPQP